MIILRRNVIFLTMANAMVMLFMAACTRQDDKSEPPATPAPVVKSPAAFKQAELKTQNAQGQTYVVYVPEGYETSKTTLPLIVYLHGSGVSGSVDAVYGNGLMKYAKSHAVPALIVAPINPSRQRWFSPAFVGDVIDEVEKDYRVDVHRVALTGYSLGGIGSWATAMAYPQRFSAVAPVAGALPNDLIAHYTQQPPLKAQEWLPQLARLRETPFRIIHGDADAKVPYILAQSAYALLQSAGHEHATMETMQVDHYRITKLAYTEALVTWLLQQRRESVVGDPLSLEHQWAYLGEFDNGKGDNVKVSVNNAAGKLNLIWPDGATETLPYVGNDHFSGSYTVRFYGPDSQGNMNCFGFAPYSEKLPLLKKAVFSRKGLEVECQAPSD